MKAILQVGSEGFRKLALVCAVAVLSCMAAQADSPRQTDVLQDNAGAAKANVLPWISDVVKMRDAGVPQDVIEVYAKNTKARSALSADDVLYLQAHGLSSGVITAMIEKGGAASQPVAPAAPAYAPPAQPAPAYAQTPIYPTAPAYQPAPTYQQPNYGTDGSSVSVSYIGGTPYPYSYYYYNYPYYGYPYYSYYYPYVYYSGGRCYAYNGHTFCPTPFNHVNGVNAGVGFHNFGTSHVVSSPAFSSPRGGFSGGGTRASFSTGGGGGGRGMSMGMAHR